ncbi:ATP-binding protein [Marinobacter gelidimuriae]|uniref:ATP-binding protein n=1 Tax=Marinobacter gelidimuriae TaxID=2739064 RepID=UPI0003748FD5|nr:ATP-binding protein [Marinobacter gelidimuriae]
MPHNYLIVGNPGMGKSTTAGQIALQLQIQTPSAELIWVNDRNFEQALTQLEGGNSAIAQPDTYDARHFCHASGGPW